MVLPHVVGRDHMTHFLPQEIKLWTTKDAAEPALASSTQRATAGADRSGTGKKCVSQIVKRHKSHRRRRKLHRKPRQIYLLDSLLALPKSSARQATGQL